MKMTEADVVWVPDREWNSDAPNRGAVRVERHGSHWQRTRGDRWMPATSLGAMGQVKTKDDPIKQLLAMFILFNTLVVFDAMVEFFPGDKSERLRAAIHADPNSV
jgi:hypothetical protein